jgi:hypothetical protein
MKQIGNGLQNFDVFSLSVKEGERLVRLLIYFSVGKNQTRCSKYGRINKFKFLGIKILVLWFINLTAAFSFRAAA